MGFEGETGLGTPPAVPGSGLGQQAFELQEAFGAFRLPTAALPLEAAIDFHLDVFLEGARAGLDRGRGAAASGAEAAGELPPSVNPLAVGLEVTEEGVKFLGALQPQRTLAQGPEGGLTIGGPEGAHQAAKLRLVGAGEGEDGLGDMPAI